MIACSTNENHLIFMNFPNVIHWLVKEPNLLYSAMKRDKMMCASPEDYNWNKSFTHIEFLNRISRRSGWLRGFGELNPYPYSWIFHSSVRDSCLLYTLPPMLISLHWWDWTKPQESFQRTLTNRSIRNNTRGFPVAQHFNSTGGSISFCLGAWCGVMWWY